MARLQKPSDIVYNARRRFARQAKKYAKLAEKATGSEKIKFGKLASSSLERALKTYTNPAKAQMSLIKKLQFGINTSATLKNLESPKVYETVSGKVSEISSTSAYNARRRYARQAERYMKQAAEMEGIEKSRTETLARSALERAISTYADPKKAMGSSLIKGLAKQLKPSLPTKKVGESIRGQRIAESYAALEDVRADDSIRRELEAQEILETDIGNRIYGALVDIWKDSDYADRNQAIMDYFGAESMADVIQAIEDAGIDLYADPESMERYQEIRTAISERFV